MFPTGRAGNRSLYNGEKKQKNFLKKVWLCKKPFEILHHNLFDQWQSQLRKQQSNQVLNPNR
jgi:hypothetical protein